MELFRAGEALLRQPPLPLLSISAFRCTTARRITSRRAFATSTPFRAQDATRSFASPLDSILDSSFDGEKKPPTAPTSRAPRYAFPSDRNTARNPSARVASMEKSVPDAMEELLEDLEFGAPRKKTNNDYSDILNFHNRPHEPEPVPEPPTKLNSTVGRTITVNEARGMDVGRAFRQLDIRCSQNKVKSDFQRQRYHERPGLKRKRLKSERWRRNFKESFQSTIKMVQALKKQGW